MDLENEKLCAALSGRQDLHAPDANPVPIDDATRSRIEWSLIGIPPQWKYEPKIVDAVDIASDLRPSATILPADRADLVAQIDDAITHLNDCERFASTLSIAAHRLSLTNDALSAIVAADPSTVGHWRRRTFIPSATRREASLRRLREYVTSDSMIEEVEQRYGIVDLPEVRTQGSRRVVDMSIDLAMATRLCELWSEFGSNTLRLDHVDTRIFHALNACRTALIK